MQIITHEPVQLSKVAPKYARMPCAWSDKFHDFLTPRAVSRQVPWLSRGELTLRRNAGVRPYFETISGCIMYSRYEIEAVVMEEGETNNLPSWWC